MRSVTQQQVLIESHGARLMGMLYLPPAPVCAILFCDPLFEERKAAQRVMVETALQLASDCGAAVLRFDCRGCGDSPGEFEAYSIPDWYVDMLTAIEFLRAKAGAVPVVLLGLRAGAALAFQVAADRPEIRHLILWEPMVSGRDYLRQELRKKLMKEMITFGRNRETREALFQRLENNETIDFDGYPITPALYRDLNLIDLAATKLSDAPRSLFLAQLSAGEAFAPPVARLKSSLTEAGHACHAELIREPPIWNLIGYAPCPDLIKATAAWLASKFPQPAEVTP